MEITLTIKAYLNNDNSLNLNKLVDDFTGYVFMIIKNMSKDVLTNEDFEEILSDVFLVVWKNKDKIDLNLPIKPYIAGISKNIIKNKFRNLKLTESIDDNFEMSSNFNMDSFIENNEINEIISNELNKMEEIDRKVFVLFYFNGKKSKEIAELLNLTEFNVSTKLHRIRKKLKDVLKSRGYSYGK